jgi:hypothetical protein
MTSDPRARASRQNGARSRGPSTAAGKARSARNSLRHGLRARKAVLLDDEDATEFRAFARALRNELAPEGRLQADLVSRIVMAAWRARRADKLEAGVLGRKGVRNLFGVSGCFEVSSAVGTPEHDVFSEENAAPTSAVGRCVTLAPEIRGFETDSRRF